MKPIKPILLICTILMLVLVGKTWGDAFEVEVYAGLREEYNDNIFFSADQEVDDLITTLTAGLEIADQTETLAWSLAAEAAPFFYRDHDELNDVDQDYKGRIDYRISSQWRMDARAGFKVDNRPDRDIEETGQVYNSQPRHRTTAGFGGGYVMSEIQNVSASYAYEADDWQERDSANIDYQGHSLNLGTSRDISRWLGESTLTGTLGLGRFNYENGGDIRSGFARLGLARMLSEIYRFEASLGARYTETHYQEGTLVQVPSGDFEVQYEDKQTETWGGLGSLGLEYLGARNSISLGVSHDLRPAQGTAGPSNLTKATADWRHQLKDRLNLGLYGGYFINRAEAGEYYTVPVDRETFNIRPRVWWEFNRRLTLEGAYSYSYVTDHEADTHSQRHLVYVELIYVWPVIGD